MKKDIFMKLLREMARGHGWQLGDRNRDWERLFQLCEQLVAGDYSVKAVEGGIAHANDIHPQYMPTNPMLLRCVKTAHENERRARATANAGTKTDQERYAEEQAKIAQWNRENQEQIRAGIIKPKCPNPAIWFGQDKS